MMNYTDWQTLFRKIESDSEQIMMSPSAQKTYKNKAIKITVRVDDTKGDQSKNAKARIISENNFEILIDAGLIKWLLEESLAIVEDCPYLFFGLDRDKNQDIINELAKELVFDTWIDFVVCHEFSHILGGHVKRSELIGIDRHSLEAEADATAATLMAYPMMIMAKFRSYSLTDDGDLYNRLLSIFLLFELFEATSDGDNQTHPAPKMRAFVFASFFMKSSQIYSPTYSNINIEKISGMVSYTYHIHWRRISLDDYESLLSEFSDFCSLTGLTISNLDMKNYRII